MAFLKAVFKAFYLTKYRWASVEFKDGSVLWGSVTEEVWRELTAHTKLPQSGSKGASK